MTIIITIVGVALITIEPTTPARIWIEETLRTERAIVGTPVVTISTDTHATILSEEED